MVDLLLTMELQHNEQYFSKQVIGLSVCMKIRDKLLLRTNHYYHEIQNEKMIPKSKTISSLHRL
jgi:catechol-2,3-dioxygenase